MEFERRREKFGGQKRKEIPREAHRERKCCGCRTPPPRLYARHERKRKSTRTERKTRRKDAALPPVCPSFTRMKGEAAFTCLLYGVRRQRKTAQERKTQNFHVSFRVTSYNLGCPYSRSARFLSALLVPTPHEVSIETLTDLRSEREGI